MATNAEVVKLYLEHTLDYKCVGLLRNLKRIGQFVTGERKHLGGRGLPDRETIFKLWGYDGRNAYKVSQESVK